MEKIINYKVKDFFQLQDENLVGDYLMILEMLNPLKEIPNPNYRWYKRNAKKLQVKSVKELSFTQVITIRNNCNQPSIYSIIDSIKILTDLEDKEVVNFKITQFYGIISYMKSELMDITNMENNELNDDSFNFYAEAVNAQQRMGRFGVLNIIDSLAEGDILKWDAIQKLPYLMVFTKLVKQNLENKIRTEMAELEKKKQPKN